MIFYKIRVFFSKISGPIKTLLCGSFILLIPALAHAQLQELELIPLENSEIGIPVFRDYPDDAAIIITSSLTNLQFDSNVGIVADLSSANEGEYRLIIPPFRQSITVNATGYRQLRFTVPITGPRDTKVYEIRPLQQQENEIPIVLNITPLDAAVFIDEQAVDINTAQRLAPGTHTIRIEKGGYETITDEFVVDENSFRFDYSLTQVQLQVVTITTNPGQADIEIRPDIENQIENVRRANDNYQDFLFPGNYFVRISKEGYRTINQTITVEDNPSQDPTRNVFNFQLESIAGQLLINVTPSNAQVFLNRQTYNPNGPIYVSPGPYLLEVMSTGHRPYSETITIDENGILTRDVVLEQITGSMLFRIQPINASVTLYNSAGQFVDQWTGIRQFQALPIGSYRIEATAPDYQSYSENLQIFENQTYNANVEMVPISELERQAQERKDQLERDRANIAAAEEEKRQQEAARERRRGMFKHPDMSGLYLHYGAFTADASAFETNVTDQFGLGLGFFGYKNYQSYSFDFIYNSYTLDTTSEYDEIISYNFSFSYVPTLSLGPAMIGLGLGLDFTQYEYETDTEFTYLYTADPFYTFQLSLKPRDWAVGFMFDTRNSIEAGLTENYYPWNIVRYTLIWDLN